MWKCKSKSTLSSELPGHCICSHHVWSSSPHLSFAAQPFLKWFFWFLSISHSFPFLNENVSLCQPYPLSCWTLHGLPFPHLLKSFPNDRLTCDLLNCSTQLFFKWSWWSLLHIVNSRPSRLQTRESWDSLAWPRRQFPRNFFRREENPESICVDVGEQRRRTPRAWRTSEAAERGSRRGSVITGFGRRGLGWWTLSNAFFLL